MPKSKPYIPATFDCRFCGVTTHRKHRIGQVPKWCSQRCADLAKKGAARECENCGASYFGLGERFCTPGCAGIAVPTGDARIAALYYEEDWPAISRIIEEVSDPGPNGCWLWTRRLGRDGYGRINAPKGRLFAHRVSLEAHMGAPLGEQPAHHICAVRNCVNPAHLQPVTAAQNMAEMMARRTYIRRIRDLEAALAVADPEHPLLHLIPVV